MKERLEHLITEYRMTLSVLERNKKTEKDAGRGENESYFHGCWCQLGKVLCDLEGWKRKLESE